MFPGLNFGGSFTIGGEGSVFPGLDLGGTITVDTSDPGGWLVSSSLSSERFDVSKLLDGSFTIGGEGSVFPGLNFGRTGSEAADVAGSRREFTVAEELSVAGWVSLCTAIVYGFISFGHTVDLMTGLLLALAQLAAMKAHNQLR